MRWKNRWKEIVTTSVFAKDKGLRRVLTGKEMGGVLDYPVEKTSEMTENQLNLLTEKENVPGKIIYSALFSITTQSSSSSLLDSSCLKRCPEATRILPSISESKKQRINRSPPWGSQSLNSAGIQGSSQDSVQDSNPALTK